jgi:hypothetical protein
MSEKSVLTRITQRNIPEDPFFTSAALLPLLSVTCFHSHTKPQAKIKNSSKSEVHAYFFVKP